MSILSRIRHAAQAVVHAVTTAANAVADAVTTVGNAVGNAVADVIESIGNAITDGCNFLADHIHIGFISGALRWFGNLAADACTYVAGLIKSALNLIASVISGIIKIATGIITLNPNELKTGFNEIVESAIAYGVLNFLNIIQLIQTAVVLPNLFGVKFKRSLSNIEKELLKKVFGNSIALFNIRIHEGHSGLFSIGATDTSFTIGNTIYFRNNLFNSLGENFALFVHENTHVWQYQNKGANYIGNSLLLRAAEGDTGQRDWKNFLINDGISEWQSLNVEAEAEFLQDVFLLGTLTQAGTIVPVGTPVQPLASSISGHGVFYEEDGSQKIGTLVVTSGVVTSQNFTKFALETHSFLRSIINSGISQFFS